MRYDHLKSWWKRARQGLFRFCIYGALLVAGEVAFYTITKVGRIIPQISFLFQYEWLVDPKLELGHIWDIEIHTLFGQASLYMFFVYATICVFGLEPAYRFMKKKDVPLILRGIVYMFIILGLECALGWVLVWLTGCQIWYYRGPGTIWVYTSWAIAPMWFICGLISENVINLIDSFDELKMNVYGIAQTGSGPKNQIVFISDVHIGPRGRDGADAGWFFGVYEVYLTILLHKISHDRRVRELVFVGDLFDDWLYPPETRPLSIRETIASWRDSLFMAPLRACIEKLDAVWYISGNHDMHVRQDDLEELAVGGKNMRLVDHLEFEKSHVLSCGTVLAVEHGHEADFFNATDRHPEAIRHLPLGYFVARIFAATESQTAGPGVTVDKLLRAAYSRVGTATLVDKGGESRKSRMGQLFIRFFIDALLAYVNGKLPDERHLNNRTRIYLPSVTGQDDGQDYVTVRQVKECYSWLLEDWLKTRSTSFFVATGKNGLEGYAREKFGPRDWKLWFSRLFSGKPDDLFVIMGHTHSSRLEYVMDRQRQGVYANTGAICKNDKQRGPSWVVVTDSPKRARVRVKKL